MNAITPEDDGIPVLTDVVTPEAHLALPAADDPHLERTQRLYTLAQPEEPVAMIDPDAWLDELSLRVQSRVLAGLTMRIDPIVEQRLRESLTDLLEQVLAGMTAELKVTARNIVRDAVAQAVAAELAALHKTDS